MIMNVVFGPLQQFRAQVRFDDNGSRKHMLHFRIHVYYSKFTEEK